jgi:hypothetical protein
MHERLDFVVPLWYNAVGWLCLETTGALRSGLRGCERDY